MKKYTVKEAVLTLLFFAGFLGGVLFISLWGNTYLRESELIGIENLRMLGKTQTNAQSLFLYLLPLRLKVFLIMGLLGYTAAGLPALLLFLGWIGFTSGAFSCLLIARLHLMGLLFFLAAILPQALFYVPATVISASKIYDRSLQRWKYRRAPGAWQEEKQYVRTMVFAGALILLGAILESSVNPWLLRRAVNYFLY